MAINKTKLLAFGGIWLLVVGFFLLKVQFGENFATKGGVFSIHFDCYGLDNEELINVITIPFEEELNSLGDFREIRSVTEFGKVIITVCLHEKTQNKEAYKKIHQKMYEFYDSLPTVVQRPKLYQSDSKQRPVFSAFLWSDTCSISDLSTWIEKTVLPQLENLEGVAEISITGKVAEEILIEFDTNKAAFGSINPDLFGLTIQNNVIEKSRFFSKEGNFIQPLEMDKVFSSLLSLKTFPLKNTSRSLIQLDSISEITKKNKEVEKVVRLNGKEGLGFSIKICDGADIFQICDTAENLIQNNKGIESVVLYNQGKDHETLLKDISLSVLESALLAMAILPFLFGISRNLFLVILSIPFSVLGTFSTLSFFNFYIDVYVLAGFSIGLGLLLDNALIILEIAEKSLCKNVFFQTVYKMIPSFISATITTIFCFIPLFFLDFLIFGMRTFSLTIIVLLGYSLLFILFVMPNCMAIEKRNSCRISKCIQHFFVCLLERVSIFFADNYLFAKILFISLFCVSLFIIIHIPKSISGPTEKNYMFFYCDYEPELSKEVITEESDFIIQEILKIPDIRYVSTEIQKGNLEGCIYFNEKKLARKKLHEELYAISRKLPRGFLYFAENNTKTDEYLIELCIIGNSQKESQVIAKNLAAYCSHFDQIKNAVLHFKKEEESFSFFVDKTTLNLRGLTAFSLANTLHWIIYGPVIESIFLDKEYDIRIKGKNTSDKSLDEIKNIYIPGKNKSIRLAALGEFVKTSYINRHNRKNLQDCAFISLTVTNKSYIQAKEFAEQLCQNFNFPQGFTYSFSYELESAFEKYCILFCIFLCCGILLFLLLVAMHENYKKALYIISFILPSLSLPLAIKTFTKGTLFLGDVIGIICVCGLVINNGIFIVEGNKNSIIDSVKEKVLSLLSANLTTILGAIPLCFKSSLGFVSDISFFVFWGTFSAFILTIFIAPGVFKNTDSIC